MYAHSLKSIYTRISTSTCNLHVYCKLIVNFRYHKKYKIVEKKIANCAYFGITPKVYGEISSRHDQWPHEKVEYRIRKIVARKNIFYWNTSNQIKLDYTRTCNQINILDTDIESNWLHINIDQKNPPYKY